MDFRGGVGKFASKQILLSDPTPSVNSVNQSCKIEFSEISFFDFSAGGGDESEDRSRRSLLWRADSRLILLRRKGTPPAAFPCWPKVGKSCQDTQAEHVLSVQEFAEGRDARPDARVVGDDAVAERNVQVRPDQDPHAADVVREKVVQSGDGL